jgi:uncharacterized protein (TIGR00159 family)
MSELYAFFRTLQWQDILDITFNSYILFRLYVLFRGTYVFRVLIGIALLWIIQRIAVSMNLVLTSWALQGIIAAAAVIVIVVFRNEIRSVLQAKNLKTILWGYPHKSVPSTTEAVTQSAFELAKKRHGALIVMEGKDDLKEVVHSGISWGGEVSREMLVSIFWHGNPIHDGAAVIRDGRVTEVGVILPVSRRQDLPSHYGTRHRAAAGLSEQTDALVLAISEERGEVVVAKDGQLQTVSHESRLSEILDRYTSADAEKRRPSRRTDRIELSIAGFISVLFIAGLWFAFTRGLDTLVTLDIPIEYMNRASEMEILDTSVKTIRLQLHGSGAIIKSISNDQVGVRLDLKKAVVGRNSFTITNEDVILPPGVGLGKIEPSVVEVTLDVPAKKELPVQVDWVGRLPKGFILREAKLDKAKVQVSGGSSILKDLSTIYTEKVQLDNIKGSGTITANIALNPASLKIVPDSDGRVKIALIIDESPGAEEGQKKTN